MFQIESQPDVGLSDRLFLHSERDGHALRGQLLVRGGLVHRRTAQVNHALPRSPGAMTDQHLCLPISRVALVIVHLGLVDLNLECPTIPLGRR